VLLYERLSVDTCVDLAMTEPSDLASNDDSLGALLRRAAHDEAPPPAVGAPAGARPPRPARPRRPGAPPVRARAVALHAGPARAVVAAAGALLRRVVALAVPDDGGSAFAPAYGVRGAAAPGRQWLFRTDECEIDLRVSGGDEAWVVSGQLFGAADANRVVLSLSGAPDAVFELGPTSEFAFAGLRAGRYALTVKFAEVDIVVPEFVVGPVGNG
jgi:hypothetical protein